MTLTVDSQGHTITEVGEADPSPEPSGLRVLTADTDIAAVGATITGGAATYHQALVASDAFGVQLSAGGYVTIGYNSSLLPGGAFVKQFDIAAQASSPYGDNTLDLYRDVAITRMPVNANQLTISGFPIQVATTDEAGNWLFDQADFDTIQTVISAPAGPAAVQVNVNEVHIVIDFVSEPICNLTPVADIVDPSIVVNWTHSANGSDNYTGSQSQIKVFTEAQYTAAGFDPATSVPYFDSGVIPYVQVVWPATNTITIPITESGTYRVYAHTSQLIADGHADIWFPPSGYYQWSGWKFSGFVATLPVTTKNLSYWNGTAWVDGPVRYWDGAAYVDAPAVKYWNGAAWADAVN